MSEEQKEELKKEAVKKEAKKFSFVGIVATIIDYTILNIGTVIFRLPLVGVNVVSTTLASIVSYKLNKHVVFEGQRHSRKKTLALYVFVIGTGIYIIQNVILYLIGHKFDAPTTAALSALEQIGLPDFNERFVSTNLAKVCASSAAAVWNYIMLRKYVFLPESHVIERKHRMKKAAAESR